MLSTCDSHPKRRFQCQSYRANGIIGTTTVNVDNGATAGIEAPTQCRNLKVVMEMGIGMEMEMEMEMETGMEMGMGIGIGMGMGMVVEMDAEVETEMG